MNINIKPNTYVKPEPREEVVQMICDTFLSGETFAPHCGTHVENIDGHLCFSDGKDGYYPNAKHTKFTPEEMNIAFQALIKAGYHMMRYDGYTMMRPFTNYHCRKSTERRTDLYKTEYEVFGY